MAIIDPEGLFHGDRIRKCSNLAQFLWPRFFLAANGLARIEINYALFLDGPLASLNPKPSREEVFAIFREYFQQFLGFLYKCDGKIWCQFVTDKQNLPRYQTKEDRRSPEPPQDYEVWLAQYQSLKEKSHAVDIKEFESICEVSERNYENFENIPEEFPRGVGIGVGVGEGIGNNIPPTPQGGTVTKKKKRRNRTEIFAPFSDDVKFVVNTLGEIWPKVRRGSKTKITSDLAVFASRVQDVLASNKSITSEILIGAGRRYLAEDKDFPRAPEFFFGPGKNGDGPPWLPYARMEYHEQHKQLTLAVAGATQ